MFKLQQFLLLISTVFELQVEHSWNVSTKNVAELCMYRFLSKIVNTSNPYLWQLTKLILLQQSVAFRFKKFTYEIFNLFNILIVYNSPSQDVLRVPQ